jgi:hypothetical protein
VPDSVLFAAQLRHAETLCPMVLAAVPATFFLVK